MGGNASLDKKDILVGLAVRNCTFANTGDGVRIKTWESPHEGVASGFTYEDIRMDGVQHPINIDQHYYPFPPCDTRVLPILIGLLLIKKISHFLIVINAIIIELRMLITLFFFRFLCRLLHIFKLKILYTITLGVTSKLRTAVSLNCSSVHPCENIVLKDINLVYKGKEGPAIALCSNIHGSSSGIQKPPSCLR
jgi:galacturan 1,4-alpha-galacturonidase